VFLGCLEDSFWSASRLQYSVRVGRSPAFRAHESHVGELVFSLILRETQTDHYLTRDVDYSLDRDVLPYLSLELLVDFMTHFGGVPV
jgi:hypothetical protein